MPGTGLGLWPYSQPLSHMIKQSIAALAFVTCCLGNPADLKAQSYSCNSVGGYTSCYGSDGSSYSGSTIGGYSSGTYYDGNGNSSYTSCSTIGGYTSCSSF